MPPVAPQQVGFLPYIDFDRGQMVRLGRFELSTSCFGGTRSIQVSYSRAHPLYHALRPARIPVLTFRPAGCHGTRQSQQPSSDGILRPGVGHCPILKNCRL